MLPESQSHDINTEYMNTFDRIRVYFNLRPDLEEEQTIIEEVTRGVSYRGANLWILIAAIFIASLGLNVNSTAVIIGAMLISPLMGPIIGMGLAVGTNDLDLLKRSLRTSVSLRLSAYSPLRFTSSSVRWRRRSRSCWHVLRRRSMTYSSPSSVVPLVSSPSRLVVVEGM